MVSVPKLNCVSLNHSSGYLFTAKPTVNSLISTTPHSSWCPADQSCSLLAERQREEMDLVLGPQITRVPEKICDTDRHSIKVIIKITTTIIITRSFLCQFTIKLVRTLIVVRLESLDLSSIKVDHFSSLCSLIISPELLAAVANFFYPTRRLNEYYIIIRSNSVTVILKEGVTRGSSNFFLFLMLSSMSPFEYSQHALRSKNRRVASSVLSNGAIHNKILSTKTVWNPRLRKAFDHKLSTINNIRD